MINTPAFKQRQFHIDDRRLPEATVHDLDAYASGKTRSSSMGAANPRAGFRPVVARGIEAMHAARHGFVLDAVSNEPSKLFEPASNQRLAELGIHVEGTPFSGPVGPHRPSFGNVTFLLDKENQAAAGPAKVFVAIDGSAFNMVDTRQHLATVFGSDSDTGPVLRQAETLAELLYKPVREGKIEIDGLAGYSMGFQMARMVQLLIHQQAEADGTDIPHTPAVGLAGEGTSDAQRRSMLRDPDIAERHPAVNIDLHGPNDRHGNLFGRIEKINHPENFGRLGRMAKTLFDLIARFRPKRTVDYPGIATVQAEIDPTVPAYVRPNRNAAFDPRPSEAGMPKSNVLWGMHPGKQQMGAFFGTIAGMVGYHPANRHDRPWQAADRT